MLLTKHEGETFQNQTVYISGQAFIRCNFVACTLVLRETVYHLEGCSFERCNWHVDVIMMWGSPESLREIKSLVAMLEKAQEQAGALEQQQGSTTVPSGQKSVSPVAHIPPLTGPRSTGATPAAKPETPKA